MLEKIEPLTGKNFMETITESTFEHIGSGPDYVLAINKQNAN
jgi:hypothetical protein